jgi:hypothetical protein
MADSLIIVRQQALQESVNKQEAVYNEAVDKGTDKAATDESGLDPYQKARFLAAWNYAMGDLDDANPGSTLMTTAQNGVASRIQTALVEYAASNNHLQLVRPATTLSSGSDAVQMAELLEVKFDNFDWLGWMGMAYLFVFKPDNATWQAPPIVPDTIATDSVIAVFGDWGTGLYGAPFIANQIKKLNRCDVALHLGDTYYAGRGNEITKRLIGDWPTRDKTINRTLNGNHEMYSGGIDYFKALQDRDGFFNQSSSCFAMQNEKWLLLGLDSSYIDSTISDEQAAWITSMVNGAVTAGQKVILFSHHQIYSKFDNKAGQALQSQLGPLLDANLIYAWFFGHEHRMVLFEAHSQWGVRARCVGNGGFPEFRPQRGNDDDPLTWLNLPKTTTSQIPAAISLDGANRFVKMDGGDPGRYIPHAFMTLEFAGDQVFETYIDPDGNVIRVRQSL